MTSRHTIRPRLPAKFSLLGAAAALLVAVGACDGGTSGGSGGGTAGSAGWGGDDTIGDCFNTSCSSALANGGYICPIPASQMLYDDLRSCACTPDACDAKCGGLCTEDLDPADDPCVACMKLFCNAQLYACADDA